MMNPIWLFDSGVFTGMGIKTLLDGLSNRPIPWPVIILDGILAMIFFWLAVKGVP